MVTIIDESDHGAILGSPRDQPSTVDTNNILIGNGNVFRGQLVKQKLVRRQDNDKNGLGDSQIA